MENNKEVISLRRLAARCISNSEDEGLEVLDEIVEASYAALKRSYMVVDYTFKFFGGAFFVLGLISLGGAADGALYRMASTCVYAATVIALLLAVTPMLWWRWIQYGRSSSQQAILNVVAQVDAQAKKNLNIFFQFLRKEENRPFFSSVTTGDMSIGSAFRESSASYSWLQIGGGGSWYSNLVGFGSSASCSLR